MPKSPKDPKEEHLTLKLLGLEASATGRFPVVCLAVITLLVLIGSAAGLLGF